uniref:Hydrophobic seed protein domain-containing protein n=1 Tax=Setaria viridis TaxID=4556 RepID=A0A4U6T9A4_SETVI|nr:hypothetical protein SEVIR_9G563833v2 [Setaria viridis]
MFMDQLLVAVFTSLLLLCFFQPCCSLQLNVPRDNNCVQFITGLYLEYICTIIICLVIHDI